MEEEELVVDVAAIGEKYEEKGYFRRLKDMFSGLGKPHNTPEYKLAKIELQRQMAPLIAIVSVVLFFIILVVVTAMTGPSKDKYEVQIAEAVQEPELEDQTEPEPPDDIEPPPLEEVEITVDTPNPGPISELTPVATPPSEQVSVKPATQDTVAFVDSPVKMRSMTGSRNPGSIGAMTNGGAGYGDPVTEATVMKVLWWLKAKQAPDGSWKGGSSQLANTALAILTYLAHGEYPNSESPFRKDFGPVVQKGIDFIINGITVGQDNIPHIKGSDGHEYAFLIATYALCEAFGMTKNPNCKYAAMQCLERIVKGQSPTGGWDYNINPKSNRDDLSFAGWALQALKAGKMAGLHPEGLDECIKKAVKCLQTRNFHKDHFTYCAANNHHPGLTATGCLALQLLGYGNKPEVRASLDYMKNWKPSFDKAETGVGKDCPAPQYYCYYATQCKYQAGMKQGALKNDEMAWKTWNAQMKKLYPSSIKDLPEKVKDWSGKEHKQGYFQNTDSFSTRPVMDTCLAALQLMVYYRYLPTTQTTAAVAEEEPDAASAAVNKDDVGVVIDI